MVSGLAMASPTKMSVQRGAIRFTAHQTFSSTDGVFKKWGGTFGVDRDALGASSFSVWIDAKSIDTDNGGRDDHLRTEDFFDVAKFPKITFDSTAIEVRDARNLRITGDLTIKGRTIPVTFDAQLTFEGETIKVLARLTVDRNKLGLTYETPFYAPTLKPSVNLTLDLVLAP